ncbi:Protein yciN [Salmonella enterica subsp. enterica serovar Enteritidis]|nr:Protein yciN [Salmonella enterica subsp. enterica serovar Enteritidis]
MHKETQPIDRETLLLEANKIIREHEDTMAGIVAHRRNAEKWRAGFQRRLLFRRARVTDP